MSVSSHRFPPLPSRAIDSGHSVRNVVGKAGNVGSPLSRKLAPVGGSRRSSEIAATTPVPGHAIRTTGSRPLPAGINGPLDANGSLLRYRKSLPCESEICQGVTSSKSSQIIDNSARVSPKDTSSKLKTATISENGVTDWNPNPRQRTSSGRSHSNEDLHSTFALKMNMQDDYEGYHPLASQGQVGLVNLGNTCFMNAVLQALSNSRLLLTYVLENHFEKDLNQTNSSMKGALMKSYAALMQNMWKKSDSSPVSPSAFKSSVARFAPRFTGYAQQDSQEFLRYLLEGLHEDVNQIKKRPKAVQIEDDAGVDDAKKADLYFKNYKSRENSYIVDLFVGQLQSTLRCDHCGFKSMTFDPFWDLSLPLPRKGPISLNDCINLFTAEEVLDGNEKPTCDKCKQKRKCYKSFSIHRFPKILVLHLKRFNEERFRSKITSSVQYPVNNLDLSQYASQTARDKKTKCQYDLYSVNEHQGTVYGGHYTAFAKHPFQMDKWFHYNDSKVTPTSKKNAVNSDAYVLFYELRES